MSEPTRHPPLAVPVDQAAAIIGISRAYLYRLMQSGDLRKTKIGGRTLIRIKDLEHLLEKQVEQADKQVRQKYGFGKYGIPTSYADGDPFERIAYARWASDKLTESFVNGYKAAKKINPNLKVIGPTEGSSATSGDMEAWSKGFDIYGGQTVGGQTNTLFDWVRPGGTTKLYVDLTGKPIWMMMHMSKRQMPVRDPEYIREVYSQIFRNAARPYA